MDEPHFNGPLARLLRREFAEARRPDPWSTEVDAAVRESSAVPLCTNCLFPQEENRWFCPHCGFPTGDYVAVMPYLQVLVIGEVLRRGVMGAPERRIGPNVFLGLLALSQFAVFAPVYWFWMIRRAIGKPICVERRVPIVTDETPDRRPR